MKGVYYLFGVLMLCTACGNSQEKKLSMYAGEIDTYDCKSLEVEEQFADDRIRDLYAAKAGYHPFEDALMTFLTLGAEPLIDGSSPSTDVNYSHRIELFEKKKQLVKERYQVQCSS